MIRILPFILMVSSVAGQSFNDYDLKPHDYFGSSLKDPMSIWWQRLQHSGDELEQADGKPLVRRLLAELSIPETSQVLVFTKTSLQRRMVGPANPRAIYFNEDVYLGWMPQGRVEIISMDPELGGIFYFQRPLDKRDQPLFHREESCLGCHAGSATNFLPGLLARSVYPDENGRSVKSVDSFERAGHGVALAERWGGWYVTGYHGTVRHLGNGVTTGGREAMVWKSGEYANIESLEDFFPAEIHLRPDSNVLALLILDHQISMHHWFMEAHYRVRQGFFDAEVDGKSREDLRTIASDTWDELDACLDRLVRYLVFADEASLGNETWRGSEVYRATFLADRKMDSQGRSLKDLRLKEHIFKYRCSYMIYSNSFRELPVPLKEEIYHRLHRILLSDSEGFDHFEQGEKAAIAEILTATLPELAAYWSTIEAS